MTHHTIPAELRAEGEGKMSKRPLVASRPWTPAEEEKLRALAALGERPTTIAEQLQRSATAVYHRSHKLGIRFKRIRIAREERTFATHPERQFMEHLRGKDWVKGTTLPTSRLIASLRKKGWIEQQLQGPKSRVFYRMTDAGLAALKARVPTQESWVQSVNVGGLKAKRK
jgi:DNA-binding MarR family transcriptional regulator